MNAAQIKAALTALAACVCAEVEGASDFCFCGVLPGEAWYDMTAGCEDTGCGMAWVRLAGANPTSEFGVPDTSLKNCGKALGMTVEMGVIRCTEVPDDGTAPDAATILGYSDAQIADMVALQRALECCESFEDYSLGVWTPIGPSPSLGGAWTALVELI